MADCLICAKDLPPTAKGHRPPYCSTPFRRSAEDEKARLQAQLSRLMRFISKLVTIGHGRNDDEARDLFVRTQQRMNSLEERLLELNGGGPINWDEDDG